MSKDKQELAVKDDLGVQVTAAEINAQAWPTTYTIPPSNYSLAGYTIPYADVAQTGPPAMLALSSLTPLDITAFTSSLSYVSARVVGVQNDTQNGGTAAVPKWINVYELYRRTVTPYTINQDLLDFQNAIKRNNAFAAPGGFPTSAKEAERFGVWEPEKLEEEKASDKKNNNGGKK